MTRLLGFIVYNKFITKKAFISLLYFKGLFQLFKWQRGWTLQLGRLEFQQQVQRGLPHLALRSRGCQSKVRCRGLGHMLRRVQRKRLLLHLGGRTWGWFQCDIGLRGEFMFG